MISKSADRAESVAFMMSGICLAHCLLLPVFLALLPAATNYFDVPESFHAYVLGVTFPLSTAVLVSGYTKHHIGYPLSLGLVGLALMTGGLFVADAMTEAAVTGAGALILTFAHLRNWKSRKHYPGIQK